MTKPPPPFATPASTPCQLFMCCCFSVTKSCLTLYDPLDCSTPGIPVHHQLPEFTQLTSIESVIPSNHLMLCRPPFPPALSLSQQQGFFPVSQLFASGGQIIGASALASVLPVNIQGWFPLGLTGLISLQFKGLSRVFSSMYLYHV